MPLSTHIDGLTVHELIRILSNSRLSGVLTVVDRWRSGRLVFVWGQVVHASADGQERLGDYLVRTGEISPRDLEVVLQKQREHKKHRPLGTLLSALGYVRTRVVQNALKEQMRAAFFEILEWREGIVHLQVDAKSAASVMLDVCLDMQTLLLEAARNQDEARGTEGCPPIASCPSGQTSSAEALADEEDAGDDFQSDPATAEQPTVQISLREEDDQETAGLDEESDADLLSEGWPAVEDGVTDGLVDESDAENEETAPVEESSDTDAHDEAMVSDEEPLDDDADSDGSKVDRRVEPVE